MKPKPICHCGNIATCPECKRADLLERANVSLRKYEPREVDYCGEFDHCVNNAAEVGRLRAENVELQEIVRAISDAYPEQGGDAATVLAKLLPAAWLARYWARRNPVEVSK